MEEVRGAEAAPCSPQRSLVPPASTFSSPLLCPPPRLPPVCLTQAAAIPAASALSLPSLSSSLQGLPCPGPSLLFGALKSQCGFPCGCKWLSAGGDQALSGCISKQSPSLENCSFVSETSSVTLVLSWPCCLSLFIPPHSSIRPSQVPEYHPLKLVLNGGETWRQRTWSRHPMSSPRLLPARLAFREHPQHGELPQ